MKRIVFLFTLLCFSVLLQAQQISDFDVIVSGNCTGAPIIVTTRDFYTHTPVRAEVAFKYKNNTMITILSSGWSDSLTGVYNFTPTIAGEYMIYVSRPGYYPWEKWANITYCPQCTRNADCADDEHCADGNCTKLTGVCGYAASHVWIPYECCSNDECKPTEICTDHKCAQLVCKENEYIESHICREYECMRDADCAAGYVCRNYTCVVKPECAVDADCDYDKRCSEEKCIPVQRGACGHIVSHRWVNYECCSDTACPSEYCLDDYTCSPTARPAPTPAPRAVCATVLLVIGLAVVIIR